MELEAKEDVFSILQTHHREMRQFGVRRYGLFGSFVRSEQRPKSDINILVEFEPRIRSSDEARFAGGASSAFNENVSRVSKSNRSCKGSWRTCVANS